MDVCGIEDRSTCPMDLLSTPLASPLAGRSWKENVMAMRRAGDDREDDPIFGGVDDGR